MIKIDKSIPIPSGVGAPPKYPWGEMQVGDSFFLAGVTRNTLSSAALQDSRRQQGRKYILRTLTEAGFKGVRCWRVA